MRAFNAFRETLHAVAMTARMQDGPEVRQGLRVHFDRLKTALGQERYNVREGFGRGVLVTSIEETRELPVEVMIVAGLVDGEFPSVYQPEVFLSARRRQERERRHAWENRYLFYQAATNWTEHLYLTYPLREGENELVRSSFVDAFLKSSEVTLWEDPEEIPFARDICSREEYLRLHGSRGRGSNDSGLSFPGWRRTGPGSGIRGRWNGTGVQVPGVKSTGGSSPALPWGKRDAGTLKDSVSASFQSVSSRHMPDAPSGSFRDSLLRLREREEFEEGMTPAEKGALLHESLYEFFSGRREREPLR